MMKTMPNDCKSIQKLINKFDKEITQHAKDYAKMDKSSKDAIEYRKAMKTNAQLQKIGKKCPITYTASECNVILQANMIWEAELRKYGGKVGYFFGKGLPNGVKKELGQKCGKKS